MILDDQLWIAERSTASSEIFVHVGTTDGHCVLVNSVRLNAWLEALVTQIDVLIHNKSVCVSVYMLCANVDMESWLSGARTLAQTQGPTQS